MVDHTANNTSVTVMEKCLMIQINSLYIDIITNIRNTAGLEPAMSVEEAKTYHFFHTPTSSRQLRCLMLRFKINETRLPQTLRVLRYKIQSIESRSLSRNMIKATLWLTYRLVVGPRAAQWLMVRNKSMPKKWLTIPSQQNNQQTTSAQTWISEAAP